MSPPDKTPAGPARVAQLSYSGFSLFISLFIPPFFTVSSQNPLSKPRNSAAGRRRAQEDIYAFN